MMSKVVGSGFCVNWTKISLMSLQPIVFLDELTKFLCMISSIKGSSWIHITQNLILGEGCGSLGKMIAWEVRPKVVYTLDMVFAWKIFKIVLAWDLLLTQKVSFHLFVLGIWCWSQNNIQACWVRILCNLNHIERISLTSSKLEGTTI